jgi:hypothetical protein
MPQNTPYKCKASLGNIQLAFVALIVAAGTSSCFASGWNDFVLDIGDGYVIFKNNSYDVGVGTSKANVCTGIILSPTDYNGVGPVVAYITTDKLILTKNIGAEGDYGAYLDTSKNFYFIISKTNNNVTGPLSKTEFDRNPSITALGQLNWKRPLNPHWLWSLGISIIFLLYLIPILTIEYPLVAVPVLLIIIVLSIFGFRRKSRHQGA